VQGSAEGHDERGRLNEAHLRRLVNEPPGVDGYFRRQSAPVCKGYYLVANGPALHVRSKANDRAGDLAAGGERTLGLELVLVPDDERVGIIDAACLDSDDRLPGRRGGWRDVSEDERLRRTEFLAKHGFHGINLS
jgi:hypothetical protein